MRLWVSLDLSHNYTLFFLCSGSPTRITPYFEFLSHNQQRLPPPEAASSNTFWGWKGSKTCKWSASSSGRRPWPQALNTDRAKFQSRWLPPRGPGTSLHSGAKYTEMTLSVLITGLNHTTCVGSQSTGTKPMIYVWVGMSVSSLNY